MTADKDALRKRLRTYALNASFSVAKDLNDAADALGQWYEREKQKVKMETASHDSTVMQLKQAERQLAECQKECEEQARLSGMGSEREARLMAQLSELKAKHDALVSLMKDPNTEMVEAGLKVMCGDPHFIYTAMSAVALRREGE